MSLFESWRYPPFINAIVVQLPAIAQSYRSCYVSSGATDSAMDRLDYASIDARMTLGDLRPQRLEVYALG